MYDWKTEIVKLSLIKQELAEIDTHKLWPWHLPNVGATELELMECRHFLGFELDPIYQDFLTYANGWRGFIQATDLFGTKELMGSDKKNQNAEEILSDIEDSVLDQAGTSKEALFPIAMSQLDFDVFAMVKPSFARAGMVIWFAGYEIQRFENFHDFFLAMEEYNLLVLDDLKQKELKRK